MLNEQDHADRQIRAAVKERDRLNGERFTTIRLDEPIQRGWRRFFVLSEHASRRSDAETLEAILKIINVEQRCRRPDFRFKRYKGRGLVEVEHTLRGITDRGWTALDLPLDWFRYFNVQHYSEWGRPSFRADFAHPSLFELQTEPFWTWEVTDVNPDIETRLSELDRWLASKGRSQRWDWLKGRGKWRYRIRDRATLIAREHERTIRNAMHGEVDSSALTQCVRTSLARSFEPTILTYKTTGELDLQGPARAEDKPSQGGQRRNRPTRPRLTIR